MLFFTIFYDFFFRPFWPAGGGHLENLAHFKQILSHCTAQDDVAKSCGNSNLYLLRLAGGPWACEPISLCYELKGYD